MATNVDTSRARIQTYVPEYQKAEWQRHARELDMSLSEFVRSMVQAGRRGFEPPEEPASETAPAATPSSGGEPRGSDLEERVLTRLSEEGYAGWDELLAAVTDDVERRLEETLDDLQERNEIRYSGRHGGYTLE